MTAALLFLLFGIGMVWFACYAWIRVRRARTWPTVPGRILERGVGALMRGRPPAYRTHLKYTYSVAGQDYTSDQVFFMAVHGGGREQVQQFVDGLPAPLPVHYDPQNPARCYLLLHPMWWLWLTLAMGLLAILMGLMLLVVALVK